MSEQTLIQRNESAEEIIKRRSLYAAGAGLIPIPIVDQATLLGVQLIMIKDLANNYSVDFQEQKVKAIIGTLVGGLGTAGVLSGLKSVPVVGRLLGTFPAIIFGAASTYAIGKVFTKHFEHGGTLLDLDPIEARKHFQEEFETGKGLIDKESLMKIQDNSVGTSSGKGVAKDQLLKENQELQADLQALKREFAQFSAKQNFGNVDPSDLKVIEGIGDKIEKVLKAKSIQSWDDLAKAKVEDIQMILDKAKGKFNLADPASWPEQAGLASAGEWAELKSLQDTMN